MAKVLSDDILEQRLFARTGTTGGLRRPDEADWGTLAVRSNVASLSEEYWETQPDGHTPQLHGPLRIGR